MCKLTSNTVLLAFLLTLSVSVNAGWRVNDSADPMTDERKAFAVIESTNKINTNFKAEKITVVARCYSTGSVDVVINWGQFLNSSSSAPIEVRVGTDKVVSLSTSNSTDGDAQFVRNTGAMMSMLMREEQMKLRTENYQGTKTDVAVLDTVGFRKAWKKACDWHYKYDSKLGYVYRKNPNSKNEPLTSASDVAEKIAVEKKEMVEDGEIHKRYYEEIRQKIERKWRKSSGIDENVVCKISVIQLPSGEVNDVDVSSCSPNNRGLEKSVENAVWAASPLPAAPSASIFNRKISFKFDPKR